MRPRGRVILRIGADPREAQVKRGRERDAAAREPLRETRDERDENGAFADAEQEAPRHHDLVRIAECGQRRPGDAYACRPQCNARRTKGDLEEQKPAADSNKPLDPVEEKARREEVQGVFIVKGDHAEFHKVETGIAGASDIEVLTGLEPGDTIVTGSYKAIRSMKTNARIKVDNSTAAVVDTKS